MPANKNPKADLKKLYNRAFKISLIFSFLIIIAAFKYSPNLLQTDSVINQTQEIIKIDEIVSTIQRPNIPPPPKAPQIIEATIDDFRDDFLLPDIDEYPVTKFPDVLPVPDKINDINEPFIKVPEELPEPVGGLKMLQEKVHYTEIARRAGVEGTVYIQAKIDKNGDVIDAVLLKGLGAGLDEEALNAVKSTKFLPGKQRGLPVNVLMVIPIKFVLK